MASFDDSAPRARGLQRLAVWDAMMFGGGFEEDAPPHRRGTVLAIEGVREADAPDAVDLVVDLQLTSGTVIVALGTRQDG